MQLKLGFHKRRKRRRRKQKHNSFYVTVKTGFHKRKHDGSGDGRNGRFPFSSVSVFLFVASAARENKTQHRRMECSDSILSLANQRTRSRIGAIFLSAKMAIDVVVICSWLMIFILWRRRRRLLISKQRKKKRFWMRDIFRKRESQGDFFNLVKELRLSDREYYFRYLRINRIDV